MWRCTAWWVDHDIQTVASTVRKDAGAAALVLTVGCKGHNFGCLAARTVGLSHYVCEESASSMAGRAWCARMNCRSLVTKDKYSANLVCLSWSMAWETARMARRAHHWGHHWDCLDGRLVVRRDVRQSRWIVSKFAKRELWPLGAELTWAEWDEKLCTALAGIWRDTCPKHLRVGKKWRVKWKLGMGRKDVNDLNALRFTWTLRAIVQLMISKINMTCLIVFALALQRQINNRYWN